MFGWLLQNLRRRPPGWCLRSTLWDETGQRLVLAPISELGSSCQIATWQVLVVRTRFCWGWFAEERPSVACPVMAYEPIIPPMPLVSNAAPHLFSGLFRHTVTSATNCFMRELRSLSKVSSDIFESDGATANEKMYAHVGHEDSGHLLCGNHGNHLGEMQTVSVAMYENIGARALNGVNDLYASVLFFRSQGNFLRLICSVRKALDEALVIRVGPPPPVA